MKTATILLACLTLIAAPAIYLGSSGTDATTGAGDAPTLSSICVRKLAERTRLALGSDDGLGHVAMDVTLKAIGPEHYVAFRSRLIEAQTNRVRTSGAMPNLRNRLRGVDRVHLLQARVDADLITSSGRILPVSATCQTVTIDRPDPDRFIPLRSEVLTLFTPAYIDGRAFGGD